MYALSKQREAHLISIKDAGKLVGWDGGAGRVDVGEAVVQVGRLSVHLPYSPLPAADIHNLWAHLLTPAQQPYESESVPLQAI